MLNYGETEMPPSVRNRLHAYVFGLTFYPAYLLFLAICPEMPPLISFLVLVGERTWQ
jgi:hypothetical protein